MSDDLELLAIPSLDVPAYSVLEITGADPNSSAMGATRPTQDSLPQVAFTMGCSGKSGKQTEISNNVLSWVQFEAADGDPVVGQQVGTKAGSFKVSAAQSGLIVYAVREGLCRVRPFRLPAFDWGDSWDYNTVFHPSGGGILFEVQNDPPLDKVSSTEQAGIKETFDLQSSSETSAWRQRNSGGLNFSTPRQSVRSHFHDSGYPYWWAPELDRGGKFIPSVTAAKFLTLRFRWGTAFDLDWARVNEVKFKIGFRNEIFDQAWGPEKYVDQGFFDFSAEIELSTLDFDETGVQEIDASAALPVTGPLSLVIVMEDDLAQAAGQPWLLDYDATHPLSDPAFGVGIILDSFNYR